MKMEERSFKNGCSLREPYLTYKEAQQRAKYKRSYLTFSKISYSCILFSHVNSMF